MKRFWTGAMACCLLLVACASQAEKDSARSAWGDCVAVQVARLDDGKSDPISIAYGVAPQCAVLYQRLSQMMISENSTDAGQNNMRQQMKEGEIRLITSAVLAHRASHR
jgi:hypothetical protein